MKGVAGHMKLMESWTFPNLYKMRGRTYGSSIDLQDDTRGLELQGRRYFHILLVYIQGNGVTSDNLSLSL